MDTKRLILFLVVSMSILLLWQEWEKTRHPKAAVATAPAAAMVPTAPTASPTDAPAKLQKGSRISIKTDVIEAEIDSVGGDIRQLAFLRHGAVSHPKQPFVLFQDTPAHTYVAQTGLIDAALPNLPTHRTAFKAEKTAYVLGNEAQMTVRLEADPVGGVQVSKLYTFKKGSYLVEVRYEVKNTTAQVIRPSAYFRLLRDNTPAPGESKLAPTFTGPVVYTDAEKFHKVSFEDLDKDKAKYPTSARDGWIGMIQHYFASAWILKTADGKLNACQATGCRFEIKKSSDGLYSAAAVVGLGDIAPNATGQITVPLYAGPEENRTIKEIAQGLELTKDYGWLTIIASPLFWILEKCHEMVGNWGVAIILLTLLVKGLFYPLSAASYRSMAKMRVVAPRLERLKEQFGDDKTRLHHAMMEMYKEEKINPLGGCLPVVVQIPVFIALYWALLASVELRQAPFMLWVQDLSVPDPLYILPALMAATMFAQTFLNPPPPDPVQAKMMKVMPLLFSVMFFFFPAGLVLYWLVNNVLSIAQQWYVTDKIEKDNARAKA